jgi:putative Holliday junction resolvase
MGRILGIDYGQARCGLAVSDQTETIAGSLPAWERRDGKELLECLQQFEKIVLGFPKNMDGSLGKSAEEVLAFQSTLSQALKLPIVLWDERLSSVSAGRLLKEHKLSSRRKKSLVDTISAVLILQNYLDSRKR